MTTPQPPRVAAWLFNCLAFSRHDEAIIGDLDESYNNGRSRSWYWRQVFFAVVVAWLKEIGEHKFTTICVLSMSWIHLVALRRVFGYLASGAANPLTAYVFANVLPHRWWEHNFVFWPVDWLLTWLPLFLISVFAGWLVSRFPDRQRRALVLTSLVFTCFVATPPTWRMLLGLPTVPLYFNVRGIFIPFQTLLGIALGGGLLTRCAPRLTRS
jgi:hypothetical protein